MKIIIINGSLGGANGNTALLLCELDQILKNMNVESQTIILSSHKHYTAEFLDTIISADAWIVATGTYWDSWSSTLQSFLEWITSLEGCYIVGKPVSVIITGHSVGAKGILSRLQGVFNTMGMIIPPMSGMVITMASQEALRGIVQGSWMQDELWCPDDFKIIAHNLIETTKIKCTWLTWPTSGIEACKYNWFDPGSNRSI